MDASVYKSSALAGETDSLQESLGLVLVDHNGPLWLYHPGTNGLVLCPVVTLLSNPLSLQQAPCGSLAHSAEPFSLPWGAIDAEESDVLPTGVPVASARAQRWGGAETFGVSCAPGS